MKIEMIKLLDKEIIAASNSEGNYSQIEMIKISFLRHFINEELNEENDNE